MRIPDAFLLTNLKAVMQESRETQQLLVARDITVRLSHKIITSLTLILLTLPSAFAQQTVQLRLDVRLAGAGQYQADVYYSVVNQAKTTGIGVRLHYDANVISDVILSDVYSNSMIGSVVQSDAEDRDQDARTDFFASVGWASISGAWPADSTGETLLFRLNFSLANPQTPIEAIFNFSSSSLPAGYNLSADSYSVLLPLPNNPPRGSDNLVRVGDGGSYGFTQADFGFSDPDDDPANAFKAVKISTLPAAGTLSLGETGIEAGDFVLADEIAQLQYSESSGAQAESDSFTFQVQDDGGATDLDPTPRTMTIDLDIQRRVLMEFYQSAGGDQWTNTTGWLGGPGTECDWFGVNCVDGKVTILDLESNRLTGNIPGSLSRLSNLRELQLHRNNLGGVIPADLGDISTLEQLWLNFNNLTGGIPQELGNLSNLRYLDFGSNQLSGDIPPALGDLTNLRLLSLGSNQFTGSIPSAIGNLVNLEWLSLFDNQLSGTIPDQLQGLSALTRLILGENQLSGIIPDWLGELTQLDVLALNDNQLTGRIPASLGNLSDLWILNLSGNQLYGAVPASLGNLTDSEDLDLRDNNLSWKLPQSIVDLQFTVVQISGNYFDSERNALTDLYNSTNGDAWINRTGWLGAPGTECTWYGVVCEDGLLTGVNLPGNGLAGTLPAALGATPHMQTINVANNYITAPLPDVFTGVSLNLDYNPIDTVNPVQIVSTTHDSGMLFTTSTNRLTFHYDVSDDTDQLTGLGFRIHFNSSDIDSMQFANPLAASLLAFDTTAKPDVNDFDNNPATDRYVSIAWGAVSGDWPGSLPIKLFDLDVSANETLENGARVRLGFSRISSTTGYGLRLPLLLLTATPGTFDIDGDGQVQALTDALIIIRSLFGFTGSALIDRAVAVGATNTTAEAISQRLLDVSAILDVDGNGKVDALTDGLLIMRYAFGFRGTVLINNAISNGATRTTEQDIENYINGFMN